MTKIETFLFTEIEAFHENLIKTGFFGFRKNRRIFWEIEVNSKKIQKIHFNENLAKNYYW